MKQESKKKKRMQKGEENRRMEMEELIEDKIIGRNKDKGEKCRVSTKQREEGEASKGKE